MIAAPAGTAWYVYGVVAAGDAAVEQAVAACSGGVGGPAPVGLVADHDLAAVVSEVPLEDFGEETLPTRLNDRAWLEEKARAHEDVLTRIAARSTVVPFRFGTIFRDLDAVRHLLADRREAFDAGLSRVRGCVELGVKLWREPRGPDVEAEPGAAGSGRAYLERRRDERRRAEERAALAADIAHAAHDRLRGHALAAVVNRPQPPELTGRADEMLLNAAYLVRSGDEALAAELERLNAEHAEHGLRFELTGPWPPHNFVDEGGAA